MDPMIAIAPMETVRDAVTKAFTKPTSPLLPVLAFSHSPNASNPFSMPIRSPITVPTARHSTTSMDFPLLMAPSLMRSIPSIAPAMAMNRMLTPQARFRDSCCSGLNHFPANCPTNPAATMLTLLMIVPNPIILLPR